MSNKVRFRVCGTDYIITTADAEEYVLSLAEKLDTDMSTLMQQSPSASTATAAVITALDYLDDMKKAEDSAANMRSQIKDYLEDAAKSKLEADDAKSEIERLKAEIEHLKREVMYVRQQAQQAAAIANIQKAAAQAGQKLTPQQAAQLAAQHARKQQAARAAQQAAAKAAAEAQAVPVQAEAPKAAQRPNQDDVFATQIFEPVNQDEPEDGEAIPSTMNTIEFETIDENL